MWLAFSTAAFHRAYVNEAQESTRTAGRTLRRASPGPLRQLKTAATKILKGRDRTENERHRLRSHYGFESFFCEPGIAGAWKGGVEGDIGRFRRNPSVRHAAISTPTSRHATPLMGNAGCAGPGLGPSAQPRPLSVRRCGCARRRSGDTTVGPVDTKARVCVRQALLRSGRLVGQRATIELGAGRSSPRDDRGVSCPVTAREHLDLDHYLEGCGDARSVPIRAPASRSVRTPTFWDFRATATRRPRPATCALHRHHDNDHVISGIRAPCRRRRRRGRGHRGMSTSNPTAVRAGRAGPRPVDLRPAPHHRTHPKTQPHDQATTITDTATGSTPPAPHRTRPGARRRVR